jgi:hypothetical protein
VSATETWLVIAAVVAGIAAVLHLLAPALGPRTVGPGVLEPLGRAFTAAAIALVAIALVVAFP